MFKSIQKQLCQKHFFDQKGCFCFCFFYTSGFCLEYLVKLSRKESFSAMFVRRDHQEIGLYNKHPLKSKCLFSSSGKHKKVKMLLRWQLFFYSFCLYFHTAVIVDIRFTCFSSSAFALQRFECCFCFSTNCVHCKKKKVSRPFVVVPQIIKPQGFYAFYLHSFLSGFQVEQGKRS